MARLPQPASAPSRPVPTWPVPIRRSTGTSTWSPPVRRARTPAAGRSWGVVAAGRTGRRPHGGGRSGSAGPDRAPEAQAGGEVAAPGPAVAAGVLAGTTAPQQVPEQEAAWPPAGTRPAGRHRPLCRPSPGIGHSSHRIAGPHGSAHRTARTPPPA